MVSNNVSCYSLIILDLARTGEIFSGQVSKEFGEIYSFLTSYMSRIERDHSQDLSDTKSLLEDLLNQKSSFADRQLIKGVCELIGIRAARLSAALVAGVLSKMNKLNGCTVAIDGSLYEHYPHFKNRMSDALRELFGISADNISLQLARDGSGVGAALIAAIMGATEQQK